MSNAATRRPHRVPSSCAIARALNPLHWLGFTRAEVAISRRDRLALFPVRFRDASEDRESVRRALFSIGASAVRFEQIVGDDEREEVQARW